MGPTPRSMAPPMLPIFIFLCRSSDASAYLSGCILSSAPSGRAPGCLPCLPVLGTCWRRRSCVSTSTKTKPMFITCFRRERKVPGAEEASVIRSQQSIGVIGGPQSSPHIREEAARRWIRPQLAETKDKDIQDGGRVRLPPRRCQCEVTALMSGSGDLSTGRQCGVVLEGYQCFAHTSRSCRAVSNKTPTVT